MTKIKICGITRMEEVVILNECRPDYAGFVFARSKRKVTPWHAAVLGAELDTAIKKVGVFVDAEPEYTAKVTRMTSLDVVQLHGDEDKGYIKVLRTLLEPSVEVWKAFRISASHMPDADMLIPDTADRYLFDTYDKNCGGGTGICFDWSLTAGLDIAAPVVLAGGLTPENVRKAVDAVMPFAVDASSGVESDGIKNRSRIRAFIDAVRV